MVEGELWLRHSATPAREVKKEIEYPQHMSYELVEKWGDGIPAFAEADPRAPEWKATPIIPIDLTENGYGEVYIKNEADRSSNPTGTIKDRSAWELATLYRDYARALYLKTREGAIRKNELGTFAIPRLSLITAGNEGRAISECFRKYDLPPPKLVIDRNAPSTVVDELERLRADLYVTDLSRELRPEDIKRLSNNLDGIDITSTRAIEPSSVFYDWHVHESFNESPNEVYVPYGSGRLMENYLVWQARTMRNESEGRHDPRLHVPVMNIITMNILGAEPAEHPSVADKLGAQFKPFLLFRDEDIDDLVKLSFTGTGSKKEPVSDMRIKEAHELFTAHGIEAEPSAAAGLALYMDRFERGLIDQQKKILIVNTGKGLI